MNYDHLEAPHSLTQTRLPDPILTFVQTENKYFDGTHRFFFPRESNQVDAENAVSKSLFLPQQDTFRLPINRLDWLLQKLGTKGEAIICRGGQPLHGPLSALGDNMPILEQEPIIFPGELFDLGDADGTRSWWVLHTKSRHEKSVARFLYRSRIPFYLPVVSRLSYIGKRKYTSQIPLFTGYVFVYGSHDEVTGCRQTEHLANVLHVSDGARLKSDLQGVRRLIDSGAPLTAEQRIQPGQLVRIKSGAFQGIEGIVHRRQNRSRIVVLVQFLQQGVSMDVDDWALEPIGTSVL